MGRHWPDEIRERRRAKRAEARAWRFEVREDLLDGGYVAQCTNLPGCVSQGDTVEEALANVGDAFTALSEMS